MAFAQNLYRRGGDDSPTLPLTRDKSMAPRRPYAKLLCRFYEPLCLLKALGRVRGRPTARPSDSNREQGCRRRFLRNLATICDSERGGETCTAIGVEDSGQGWIFWVGSNMDKDEMVGFLEDKLQRLKHIAEKRKLENETAEDEVQFSKDCLEYARKRIDEDAKLLARAIDCCQTKAREQNLDAGLSEWLGSIKPSEKSGPYCLSAYKALRNKYMSMLNDQAMYEKQEQRAYGRAGPFETARHYIVQLARHLRVHTDLLRDSTQLLPFLENFKVCSVKHLESVPPPGVDSFTNLEGILNRMLNKDHPERLEIERALLSINGRHYTFKKFMENLTQVKPVVHAEIKVLEHFFRDNLKFAGNDKFIACSKPSCLCCKLYFTYHPAHMVVPQSHEKVWPNWSPPLVVDFNKRNPESRRQLGILNEMNRELRKDVISQILGSKTPFAEHPDSITDSIVNFIRPMPAAIPQFSPAAEDLTPGSSPSSSDTASVMTPLASQSSSAAKDETRLTQDGRTSPVLLLVEEESDDEDGGVLISKF